MSATLFITTKGRSVTIKSRSTASARLSAHALLITDKQSSDRQTHGRTDGRYQLHYLPRFAVDNNRVTIRERERERERDRERERETERETERQRDRERERPARCPLQESNESMLD